MTGRGSPHINQQGSRRAMRNPGPTAKAGPRDAIRVIAQVEPRQIVYVGHILEGYDHVGVLTTYDKEWGIIELSVSPDLKATALEILTSLRDEIPLSIIAVQ